MARVNHEGAKMPTKTTKRPRKPMTPTQRKRIRVAAEAVASDSRRVRERNAVATGVVLGAMVVGGLVYLDALRRPLREF
jgi:hypothetical protein